LLLGLVRGHDWLTDWWEWEWELCGADRHDHVGDATFKLSQLMCAPGQVIQLELVHNGRST